jgi:protein involved in polysaccharide export with SLBB domain
MNNTLKSTLLKGLLALMAGTVCFAGTAWGQARGADPRGTADSAAETGPMRLRQPVVVDPDQMERSARRAPASVAPPGEFELFVQRLSGSGSIRRFGASMVTGDGSGIPSFSPLVPPDYLVKPGDEILLTLWGSVDADLRLIVDRSGRVSVPRVGPVQVSGVRYADLASTIDRRVGLVFRNYQLSVSLGQLRGVRVYVTGFVARPGAYSVSSLSTLTQALMAADGPSAAGSFRQIELRRGGKVAARFDFYDFLLNGDRSADRVLEADDVIHVAAVGQQVGLIGSVNQPAVFELKAGETIADLLRMAGGLSSVADRSRVSVERLDDRNSVRISQLALPAEGVTRLSNGDVVRVFSAVDAQLPVQRQNKRVRVEGEVLRPGDYLLPPGSSTLDALRAAGGLTPQAYVFGTDFSRESVRQLQQVNYERVLKDLELQLARGASSQRASTAEEAGAQAAKEASSSRILDRLRNVKPTGRVVLQLEPGARELPDLPVEDGDRLSVPARPTTVGVFGSVFSAGSYLWNAGSAAGDYLRLAGGPTKGADTGSVFMVRANGSVLSEQQRGGFFSYSKGLEGVTAEAGDTLFVPDQLDKTTLTQDLKDWSQILYQLGLGVAAAIAVGR